VRVCEYVCVYEREGERERVRVCVHSLTRARAHTHTHMCTHTNVSHTYTHAHTRTHAHTYTPEDHLHEPFQPTVGPYYPPTVQQLPSVCPGFPSTPVLPPIIDVRIHKKN